MSKFHSTLTRRDFMKGLGLAGAGLGAAAATTPVFHDMDEVISSPKSNWERNWWVKERDIPTVEIDWNMLERFDSTKIMQVNHAHYVGVEQHNAEIVQGMSKKRECIQNKTLGFTQRDYALKDAALFGWVQGFSHGFIQDEFADQAGTSSSTTGSTNSGLDSLPKWDGTPEENAKMIRLAGRVLGCSTVGYVELDENTIKLVNSFDWDSKKIEFEDVEQAYETDTKRVIPLKCKNVIIFSLQHSGEALKRAPAALCDVATGMRYSLSLLSQIRLQRFIRSLGYQSLGTYRFVNNMSLLPPMAIMAGLGEQSVAGQTLTPEYGGLAGLAAVFTDLTIAPTKPIDAGMWEFCQTCHKCGRLCPSGAIKESDSASWEVKGPWNNPGKFATTMSGPECQSFWNVTSTICGICNSVCPFSKEHNASVHEFVMSTVAETSLFNRYFTKLDDLFGYGVMPESEYENWWELNANQVPTWGINSTR
ncbi:MAG: reductive dehalogenase [Dehalococcoides mccartyi]|uniref:reductive dehalogenase n=1 Tax=Dehalococcoides mccartyi TaxID=61435 RepID=UPI0030FCA58D